MTEATSMKNTKRSSTAPALATYENVAKAGGLRDLRHSPKAYCVAGVPAGIGKALEMGDPNVDLAEVMIKDLEEFAEYLAAGKGASRHTVDSYRRDLEQFRRFLAGQDEKDDCKL